MTRPILREVATNSLRALPAIRSARNNRSLKQGYVPEKNSVEYTRFVFDDLTGAAGLESIGGRVLEIGPGGHVGVSLLFLSAGAEHATCLDILPWKSDQREMYRELDSDADALLERIDYRCPDAIETTTLPDGSFDIIFSAACLEHVADPARATRRMYELLRPGGVSVHGIDLRDHRDFERPHEFLRYPDWLWRAAMSRKPAYTNRWRATDWSEAFRDSGFVDVEMHSRGETPVSPQLHETLLARFRAKAPEELSTTLVVASARKPAEPSG
ncbi:MAG: methyltransferase domain-containing protein [Actinomycetota bacterium]|nr:methyltransferase domain-containing protein [Actinomycetota bacterium]